MYRNRSLWALLGAVLCHPDDNQARELARLLAEAALATSPVRFREGLRLAVLARAAAAGLKSGSEFASRANEARQAAAGLAHERWRADSWGFHSRRLAAIAEAASRVLADDALAEQLLREASALPLGFAGFRALSNLMLAESWRICRPTDQADANAAAYGALQSAHNVQEPPFCTLTTARVRTLQDRWWGVPAERLRLVIPRFESDPDAAEFAPVHRIGEPFELRDIGGERLAVDMVRGAQSLSRFAAREVLGFRLGELMRVNPGIRADEELEAGQEIRLPDRGFGSLLAPD